jgi:hypothetical protein
MARFVTIGYGDQDGYNRTDAAVRDEAHEHDARLAAAGAEMGTAGPPVHVRNHDSTNLSVTPGRYTSSALPVAGFTIIEAATMEEAIQLAAKTPCAVAQGVVEVWPLQESP